MEYEIGTDLVCACPWDDAQQERLCSVVQKRALASGELEYYVHFVSQNRRLDRWVGSSQLRQCTPQDKARLQAQATAVLAPQSPAMGSRRVTRREKRKMHVDEKEEHPTDTKHSQIDKEMKEATKVRNVDFVYFGPHRVEAWYYSPFPEQFSITRKVFVCDFCLKYFCKLKSYVNHTGTCSVRHPPGNEIYRQKHLSVFEVDGASNKVYCQCLCLLAKLFLSSKTLFFEVESFYFYVVVELESDGFHVVGYFSKEKQSTENYNLACILTFPHHQRKGYGRFLIQLSYELSKLERKVGSPERPLSDLGKISYHSYWSETLLLHLLNSDSTPSIQDLSVETAIRREDVVSTLSRLGLLKYVKGSHFVSYTPKLLLQHLDEMERKRAARQQKLTAQQQRKQAKFDVSCLSWTPPAIS